MFDTIFSQSSGRVVAIARLSLAAIFLIGTMSDPTASMPLTIERVLAAYVGLAAVFAWLIWKDWWIDARIAVATHIVDIIFFMVVVLWPEGYASPYYLFFIFLLLSASIRWGWRATALTAVAVISLYLVAGLVIARPQQAGFELQRFIIRSGQLVVLSLTLIWFGLRGRFSTGVLLADGSEVAKDLDFPLGAALQQAKRALKAQSGLVLWAHSSGEREAVLADGNDVRELAAPVAPVVRSGHGPFLFSIPKDRALLAFDAPRPRFRTASAQIDQSVKGLIRADEGLAVPVRNQLGDGFFLFWSIANLNTDHLELGCHLAAQLAQSIEHDALVSARQEGAIARERMGLARDLHDGIVQFLAGATYRIEAISRSIGEHPSAAADLQDLKELMLLEQADLRTSIAALRTDDVSLSHVVGEAGALCERLGRHWQIDCKFEAAAPDVTVRTRLQLDTLQIIREAVANAARHSSAKNVAVQIDCADDWIRIKITNDGLSQNPSPAAGPWSIRERVEDAGGTVSMRSVKRRTTLEVRLPMMRERA